VASNSDLLNLAEAAKRLRMGQSTLRQKLYAGLGPVGIKLPGSDRWKFRPADLDAYERAGELTPETLTSAAAVAPHASTRRPPARERGRKPAPLKYLDTLPREVPADRVLVHNQVRPVARRPGARGSRIWLQVLTDNPRLELCDCGWAPELGVHYRVVAPSADPSS
jgi:hypothetical protein